MSTKNVFEMNKLGQFVVVSRNQIVKVLADIHADLIFSDREEIVEGLLDGTLKERVCDFRNMSISELIEHMDMLNDMLFDENEDALGILLYDEEDMKLHIVDVGDFADVHHLIQFNQRLFMKEEPEEVKE